MIDAEQNDLEVGVRVAIHVGLNYRVPIHLVPRHRICNGVLILTTECERLISILVGIRIDCREIDNVRSMYKVRNGIGRSRGAIRHRRKNETISTRSAEESIFAQSSNQPVIASSAR